MPSPRNDQRQDYRRFPRAYFGLLDAYDKAIASGRDNVALGPLTPKQAHAAKRDLYRWKMLLINADPEDAYARKLADLFSGLSLCLEPAAVADEDRTLLLVLRPNPVAAAFTRNGTFIVGDC